MTEPIAEHSVSASSASVWEDFVDIFYAPRSVFARRQNATPWLPMIVATVVFALLFWSSMRLLAPMWDAEMARAAARAAEQNPQMTEEQLAAIRNFGRVGALVSGVLFVPVAILLVGLVTWVVGKFFDSTATLRQGFTIAAFSMFPRLIEQVVYLIQGAVLDASAMTSRWAVALSPARFMDPDGTSMTVLALADRLNPFVLWAYALIGIGLHVMGRVPGRQAAIAAVVLWILSALPMALFSGG